MATQRWWERFSESEAIQHHLTDQQPRSIGGVGMIQIRSTLVACLRDARGVSGRDLNTGAPLTPNGTGNWLGAVGYFIALDQIGKCFGRADRCSTDNNPIRRSLELFSELDTTSRDILSALRNALTHDYGLFNADAKHSSRQHRFSLTSGSGTLVGEARRRWSGRHDDDSPDATTTVDVFEIACAVEGVFLTLKDLAVRRQLTVILAGGKDELLTRYTFGFTVK